MALETAINNAGAKKQLQLVPSTHIIQQGCNGHVKCLHGMALAMLLSCLLALLHFHCFFCLQTMAMMGITFNIHALCFFAAHGLSGATSTRVGNDLGAGRPQMAWVTVQVRIAENECGKPHCNSQTSDIQGKAVNKE